MNSPVDFIRLDKFLSNAGVISRRGVKQFLKENEVTVDGKRTTESGTRVNMAAEKVLINGQKVAKSGFIYYALNKPIGIISSTNDEFARDTVTSLIDTPFRIYPVGRLDKETHGLMLLTNDGELTHKLIHPKYHVPKVYRLLVEGIPEKSQLEKLRMGVFLQDGITMPAEVTPLSGVILANEVRPGSSLRGTSFAEAADSGQARMTLLEVTLHEGRNRQIRRMCEEVGLQLIDLQRIAFGPLTLGNLKKGEYRALSKKEIRNLQDAVEKN